MTGLDYAIVIGFLVAMAAAGFLVSRFVKTSDDFFVAGRELTPFVLCATITATNVSMLHFVGMGGTAYQSGLSIGWQNWTGNMALVLSGLFVVPLMRRLRVRSVPEFLELRYSPLIRVLVGAFWGLKLCMFLGILLYVAATAAIVVTGAEPTRLNYVLWLAAFSLVSILYSAIGGAWAVAIMDTVQFVVMMAGALIVLPIAVHAAGGFGAVVEYLNSAPQRQNHLAIVPTVGEFNWLFIAAMTLLSLKWATVDQAILQRAFGARTPRAGAQGMVLSAIVTTPLALFWILPGLSAAKLHPGFSNPDYAMPWLLANTLPPVARGLLGLVLCGLVAAQVSTITSDVNSVATLFTSDIYRRLRRIEPSPKQLLRMVKISSLVCGAIMLAFAYFLFDSGGGAVRANLTLVGILDMPLFVITIVYGLTWKRMNWKGAVAGFVAGGTLGVLTHALVTDRYYFGALQPALAAVSTSLTHLADGWHDRLRPHESAVRNIVPIISSVTALIVVPLVSLLTSRGRPADARIWESFNADKADENDTFHLIPRTLVGRVALVCVLGGFATFVAGVLSASAAASFAAPLALLGLAAVLGGGLVRVYVE